LDKSGSRRERLALREDLRPDIIVITKITKGITEKYSQPYWTLEEFSDKKKGHFLPVAL
jgi:hypothetical protein